MSSMSYLEGNSFKVPVIARVGSIHIQAWVEVWAECYNSAKLKAKNNPQVVRLLEEEGLPMMGDPNSQITL